MFDEMITVQGSPPRCVLPPLHANYILPHSVPSPTESLIHSEAGTGGPPPRSVDPPAPLATGAPDSRRLAPPPPPNYYPGLRHFVVPNSLLPRAAPPGVGRPWRRQLSIVYPPPPRYRTKDRRYCVKPTWTGQCSMTPVRGRAPSCKGDAKGLEFGFVRRLVGWCRRGRLQEKKWGRVVGDVKQVEGVDPLSAITSPRCV